MPPGPGAIRTERHPLPPIGALISLLTGDLLALPGKFSWIRCQSCCKFHQPSEIAGPGTTLLDCYPGIIYFGGWGGERRSETASAGPRENRHLFLQKTRPRGQWVTLALENWWRVRPCSVCIDIVTLPESCLWWLAFWICFVNLLEDTINCP